MSLTELLRDLALFIRQDWVIETAVGALVSWTSLSFRSLYRATRRICGHFNRVTRNLEPTADALIGPAWRSFAHSLVIPSGPGKPILATAPVRQWFDLVSLYRGAGADIRYHAALPGLLVGAGLLFTFLGLAAALSAAGAVVAEGVSQAERTIALRDLLGAASVKFITSVAGLFLSIVYALLRKHELERDSFRLNTRLP